MAEKTKCLHGTQKPQPTVLTIQGIQPDSSNLGNNLAPAGEQFGHKTRLRSYDVVVKRIPYPASPRDISLGTTLYCTPPCRRRGDGVRVCTRRGDGARVCRRRGDGVRVCRRRGDSVRDVSGHFDYHSLRCNNS